MCHKNFCQLHALVGTQEAKELSAHKLCIFPFIILYSSASSFQERKKRDQDSTHLMKCTARVGLYLLLYATTSVIPCVSSGARGAGCFLCGLLCRVMPMVRWPLWFVIPCYAMVGWKSLISGDFPSDQGTGPEQQGTIWDKE